MVDILGFLIFQIFCGKTNSPVDSKFGVNNNLAKMKANHDKQPNFTS